MSFVEYKNQPWTPERALGTLGALIEGGDECGIVSEEEAALALETLRIVVDTVTKTLSILPQVQAEQMEVQQKLTTLRDDLAAVTAERDALTGQIGAAAIAWIRVSDAVPPLRDGNKLVVMRTSTYKTPGRVIVRAYYIPERTICADYYEGDDPDIDEDGAEWIPAGWYEANESDGTNYRLSGEVTHWADLPALPADDPQIR